MGHKIPLLLLLLPTFGKKLSPSSHLLPLSRKTLGNRAQTVGLSRPDKIEKYWGRNAEIQYIKHSQPFVFSGVFHFILYWARKDTCSQYTLPSFVYFFSPTLLSYMLACVTRPTITTQYSTHACDGKVLNMSSAGIFQCQHDTVLVIVLV